MKKLFFTVVLAALWQTATAGEPPQIVSNKDRVRMSTLIVVGTITGSCVVDIKTGKMVAGHKVVSFGQRASVLIKIDRVLYSSPDEAVVYSAKQHPDSIEVEYGSFDMDIRMPSNTPEIFFLTSDVDRTRICPHYPFFAWTNLSAPMSDEAEVARLIAAFDAVK